MCVCVIERERDRESVCVCVCERERERKCVCVCERERECVCGWVDVIECVQAVKWVSSYTAGCLQTALSLHMPYNDQIQAV